MSRVARLRATTQQHLGGSRSTVSSFSALGEEVGIGAAQGYYASCWRVRSKGRQRLICHGPGSLRSGGDCCCGSEFRLLQLGDGLPAHWMHQSCAMGSLGAACLIPPLSSCAGLVSHLLTPRYLTGGSGGGNNTQWVFT